MKILELCQFSAGVCGVFSRVFEESKRLKEKGYELKIFSSNHTKGTNEIASATENKSGIEIKRFPAKHLGGESFLYWKCEKEALEYNPDVIIAHNYRQPYTTAALKIAKKIKVAGKPCKVFLVTHAPFVEGNITRSWAATRIVKFYDRIVGPRTLNKFDKIIVISHWEIPFLEKMGVDKKKIEYIPNGIPEEFFSQKKSVEDYKLLFLGRLSPKKKIETLVQAMPLVRDKKITVEIVGPMEEEYGEKIKKLVKELKLEHRVIFSSPIFEIKEKIKKIDSAKIYILPSRVEGMPQSLIEAMAREKIVIGSDSMAIRDLISDGKTGFLFEFNNPESLAKTIEKALALKTKNIQQDAKKSVEPFSWSDVIEKIEKTILA